MNIEHHTHTIIPILEKVGWWLTIKTLHKNMLFHLRDRGARQSSTIIMVCIFSINDCVFLPLATQICSLGRKRKKCPENNIYSQNIPFSLVIGWHNQGWWQKGLFVWRSFAYFSRGEANITLYAKKDHIFCSCNCSWSPQFWRRPKKTAAARASTLFLHLSRIAVEPIKNSKVLFMNIYIKTLHNYWGI